MAKGYAIQVGQHAPAKVLVGHPNKSGLPTEETYEVLKQTGAHLLINSTRVWARRVQPDGKLPKGADGVEIALEAIDTRYKGNLEFLPWGTQKVGAQAIHTRYLPQSSSLDYEYQKNVQKIETRVEDGSDYINLTPGENKFDTEKEALLIQHLKVHGQNRDSVSKNPDPQLKGYTYYELTEEKADKSFIDKKEKALDAGLFIKGLSADPQSLRNLFEIFLDYRKANGQSFGDVDMLSRDYDIYTMMLTYSDTDPVEMMNFINRYKKDLLDRFEFAKNFKALDLDKEGFIGFVDATGKRTVVFEGVKEKGNKAIDWVIENFVQDGVYKATKHFLSLCSKLS